MSFDCCLKNGTVLMEKTVGEAIKPFLHFGSLSSYIYIIYRIHVRRSQGVRCLVTVDVSKCFNHFPQPDTAASCSGNMSRCFTVQPPTPLPRVQCKRNGVECWGLEDGILNLDCSTVKYRNFSLKTNPKKNTEDVISCR